MLSLLQFNIGMLQQFNICLFPSCSCVILAEKKFSPYFARFAASLCQSHCWSSGHSSLNILIWSREIWKPSNGDRKLCTWDFCHHCDLEGWKPGRYESQRQWNFMSRKLGVATFYLCLSSTLLKLLFYGTGGLSISLLDALLLALS